MQVLIVENEIYLAQSIAAKLNDIGFHCEIAATLNEAIRDSWFDVVLLSTNISGQNFYPIIDHYKDSIIILMISYVSSDTVTGPINAGAKDYILKPFMMDELLRKIEHFREYEKLKQQNRVYSEYMDYIFKDNDLKQDYKNIRLPLCIKTNQQKLADQFAFMYARESGWAFEFVQLGIQGWQDKLEKAGKNALVYCVDYHTLKKSEKQFFDEQAKNMSVIVSTTGDIEEGNMDIVELKSESKAFDSSEILSIDDYIKLMVLTYQVRYPDTELSKKLGMSRKSLWEKRKKFGIEKKK